MQLEQVRVQNYKCIEDSGWVDFERVVCLVGKNESGKTAFLEALKKLNPVDDSEGYNPLYEYPRRRYSRYKEEKHEDDPDPVASARFTLSTLEVEEIEEEYGRDIVVDDTVEVTKDYKNDIHWEIDVDEENIVENLIEERDLHRSTREFLDGTESFEELVDRVEESDATSDQFQELERVVQRIDERGVVNAIGEDLLDRHLPEFFYFDEYSIMNGEVNMRKLIRRRDNNQLTEADDTFLALLSLAGLTPEDIIDTTDLESIIAELEAASNRISDDVFEYWTQGPDLEVQFRRAEQGSERGQLQQNQQQNQNQNQDQNQQNQQNRQDDGPIFQVRVRNNRHRVSVFFDERSSGFIWFFSFLAYFSNLETQDRDIILLLDEPGLNLHAKAQHDFLRFINERLSPNHLVVYTTHSPFMLEPKNLHRARLVIDDPDEGTRISSDVLQSDEDTNFPLQAVLGYDLIQTLFVGPHCLLVEGKSDMIYLQVMSDIIDERGETSLSHRWTIVPAGGADNIPTFISLFGASDLDLAVILDDDSDIDQRLRDIQARGVLDLDHVHTISEYIDNGEGDIEDLFSEDFYMDVVNDTYGLELQRDADTPGEIDLDELEFEHPRITAQIERYFDRYHVSEGTFKHATPAKHFQKRRDQFEDNIDDETVERFATLFEDVNQIIE